MPAACNALEPIPSNKPLTEYRTMFHFYQYADIGFDDMGLAALAYKQQEMAARDARVARPGRVLHAHRLLFVCSA
jgi:hypothetical protein